MNKVVWITILLLISTGMTFALFKPYKVQASGTIYIRADGSVDPPTAPILREGSIYTLFANVSEPIVIERDNIILEGDGYATQGEGKLESKGIDLSDRRNITITNFTCVEYSYGIHMHSTNGSTILENNLLVNSFGVYAIASANNDILRNSFSENGGGINLDGESHDNNIAENTAVDNIWAIYISSSYNNTVSLNKASSNSGGVLIYINSKCNTVDENSLADNQVGVMLTNSNNNTITNNNMTDNDVAMMLGASYNNTIYHNNFINNTQQVENMESTNIWDNGYPSGGNRWSDYTGVDHHSGPSQNETGSDGIGDTSYVIDGENEDRYPLMPWTPTRYYLTIYTTAGGTTNPPPGIHDYGQQSLVEIKPNPDQDYDFFHWVLDGETEWGSQYHWLRITMNSNHTLKAVFAPARQWIRTYTNRKYDYAYAAVRSSEGGYVFAGKTSYNFSSGGYDGWLVKVNELGYVEWDKTYGEEDDEGANSLVKTSDGGYALAGFARQPVSGVGDFWLLKTDSYGNMEWNRTYEGDGNDEAFSALQTSDGGYLLAGRTWTPERGGDIWLVKTDSAGNEQWTKTFGGNVGENAYSLIHTPYGGYVIAGYTSSYGAGGGDFWLIKVDSYGNVEWNKTYGGWHSDIAYSIVNTDDGGYALAGDTESYGMGYTDGWLIKVDSTGNAQWNRTYGGRDWDMIRSLIQTPDGGFVFAGYTESSGSGQEDFWLVKTDSSGNELWRKTYGDWDMNFGHCVLETVGGEYLVAGSTGWVDGDAMLVKTDTTPPVVCVISPENKTYYQNSVDLTFTVNEPVAHSYIPGFQLSLDGGNYYYVLNGTITGLSEGTHSVVVKATDAPGGNTGISQKIYFTIELSEHLTFPVVVCGKNFTVNIDSNSTVTDFTFDETGEIRFNVTGASGSGYCNISIPVDLMWGVFTIYKNEIELVENADYTKAFNETHTTFHIIYDHSTHTIEISSTGVIPEFPPFLILILFMITTLLAVTVYRRKHIVW